MKKLSIVLAFLAALLLAVPAPAGAGPVHDLIYQPNSRPLGDSYDTWAARFGRYLASATVENSPLVHPTCRNIRWSHGVLLFPVATAEGLVDRCEIPADTPLLVSPGGTFRTVGIDAWNKHGVERLVNEDIAAIRELSVKIDGHRVHHPERFFAGSWTTIHLSDDNIFGAPHGHYRMLVEGWALILRGFSAGRHTVSLADVFLDADHQEQVGSIRFVLDVG